MIEDKISITPFIKKELIAEANSMRVGNRCKINKKVL